MSIGPFQNLPGSREMSGADTLATEPWLLPISDGASAAEPMPAEALRQAVHKASRPFWMAANGLAVAMAFALTLQAMTGIMSPARPGAVGPVADAAPPTMAVQKAAFTAER